ncbi:TPA: EpsG family protein [Streptococcus suis]
MAYTLFFTFFFLGIFFQRSKLVTFSMSVFLILLGAFNTINPDFINYRNFYILSGLGSYTGAIREPGFSLLSRLVWFFGLDYTGFLVIVFLICISFTVLGTAYYTDRINLVLSFCMFYPLLINFVQFRFFLGNVIVFFALRFITKEKLEPIKFIICIIIATSFHTISVIYLTLLFLLIKDSFKRNFLLVTALFVFGILYSTSLISNFVNSGDKLAYYISGNAISLTRVIRTGLFAISNFVMLGILRTSYRFKEDSKYVYSIEAAAILSFVFYFLVLINNEFERVLRLGYIFLFILVVNYLWDRRNRLDYRLFLLVISSVSFVTYIYTQYYFRYAGVQLFIDGIFHTILSNNSLFE